MTVRNNLIFFLRPWYWPHCTTPPTGLFGQPIFIEMISLIKKICSPTQFDHPHPKDEVNARKRASASREPKDIWNEQFTMVWNSQGQISDTRSRVKEKNWPREKKELQPYACDQAKKCYDQLNLTEVKFFNIY